MSVTIEKNDEIWTIVLHRPEVRNAVDQPTRELLQSAFDEFENNAAARGECPLLQNECATTSGETASTRHVTGLSFLRRTSC